MLKIFPKNFTSYILNLFPFHFGQDELIARTVYKMHLNKENELRNNHFRFKLNKIKNWNELSSTRLEFTNADNLKLFGKSKEGTNEYVGFSFFLVKTVKQIENSGFFFSPIYEDKNENIFHCDLINSQQFLTLLYDGNPPDPKFRYYIDILKENFHFISDKNISNFEEIKLKLNFPPTAL